MKNLQTILESQSVEELNTFISKGGDLSHSYLLDVLRNYYQGKINDVNIKFIKALYQWHSSRL